MSNVGKNIREKRMLAHMSQKHLAQNLHISRISISMWENGKCIPGMTKLLAMAALFDCTVDELLKDEERSTEDEDRNTEDRSAEKRKGVRR